MADVQNRVKKGIDRAEHDIHDISTRLQHQVNELVDRVTGVREAKRQALSLGLSIGVIIGVVVGIAIGVALEDQQERQPVVSRFLSILLAAVLMAAAVFAQDTTEEPPTSDTATYTDQFITFDYPTDWSICDDCDPNSRTLALGNTENALNAATFDEFNDGDVQILIVKVAETFFERQLGVRLDPSLAPFEALSGVLPEEIPVQAIDFADGRQAAEVIFTDEEAGANTIIWVIDLGDGARGAMVIVGGTYDVQAAEADLLTLAESFTVSDIQVTTEITETFINDTGSYRFNHPEGWLVAENENGVFFFATSDGALQTENLGDLARGEIIGLIYPSISLIPDYPPGAGEPVPATIVSFFASLGTASGYEQREPMTTMALGDGEVEAAMTFAVNETESHERIVISVATDTGVATLLAFTPIGTGDDVLPVLQSIIASIEVGDFAPSLAATEEVTE